MRSARHDALHLGADLRRDGVPASNLCGGGSESDADGHLLEPASIVSTTATLACEHAWEVDFDIRRDRHAAQSVAFLRLQGFDFNAACARSRLGGVRGEAHRDPIGAAAQGRGRRADVIGERLYGGRGPRADAPTTMTWPTS